jgi:hypothetical protein
MFLSQMDGRTKEILDVDLAIHPFSLAAKMESDDFPGFREIMRMDLEERNRWLDSMDEELRVLFETRACELVKRSEVVERKKEIVKSTWAFRRKRKPSGEISKLKSRLCVRGDLQRDQAKYGLSDTFAPTVDWVTIRLLLTLSMVENWTSASIDFASAFTQAKLPEPIFLELPPGLDRHPEYKD